jgi:hypothetical protein
MHMAARAAAWVAWAVWTCNTLKQGIRSKESGLRSALFFCPRNLPTDAEFAHGFAIIGADTVQSVKQQSGWFHGG